MANMALTNKRGQSVKERLEEEFNYICLIEDTGQREMLACKALGAADIAIEFGLITYTEWTHFVNLYFQM